MHQSAFGGRAPDVDVTFAAGKPLLDSDGQQNNRKRTV